ncbi:B12-binding domain-containing radical SAM protein [Moorella sp. Hama-1]|uniref:B12-binding domain-containing radical SAM protein n=1 Tax=Moorella sp. Hama-1 TaxID=2138101 RepID=UPI000D64D85E|nr:B12-binding domain-containing radical SAM protein [Moorella sp. Hama-1]BCV20121.1 B12-binding domain-containing radical SAM protein [Moorella sp. Hama-1]
MRVLLTTLNAKYIHVNLALRYLRACCRDLPLEFILDEFTINDRPEHIAAAIYRHRPDLVAFSCYIWNIEPTLAVAAILKKVRPELTILCGGPEVSFDTAAFLAQNPQVDLVITGEGEIPFRALLERLAGEQRLPAGSRKEALTTIKAPETGERSGPGPVPVPAGASVPDRLNPSILAAIPGLAWRQGGLIHLNPVDTATLAMRPALPGHTPTPQTKGAGGPETTPSPYYKDLDAIPFPYAEDLATGVNDLRQRTVYYETSRGCPFACGFCLSSTTMGLRYFSLERVRENLARLLAAGVREIKFVDRTFNAHKKRALAIWEYLLSLRPKARFYFEIAGDHLDEEMLSFLSRVPPGLFQFEIGVQTIDAGVNARCNRRQDWELLAANIRRLQAAGNIRLHLDLIAGLPGEGYAGVGKSFDAVAALKPHEIQLGFLKLLKGTDLRARAGEFGYLYLDRPPYQVLASSAIAYEEMLRLHDIEVLLKYYGNSHLADHALDYLVQAAFNGSPFACYAALAAWWETRGLLRRGHSQRDLFNHLAVFALSLTRGIATRIVIQPLPGYHSSLRNGAGNIHGAGSHGNPPAGPGKIPIPEAGLKKVRPEETPSKLEPAHRPTEAEQPAAIMARAGCLRNLTQAQLDRFYQLLKFDFLRRDCSRNFPDWVPPSPLTGEERANCMVRITAPRSIEKYIPGLAKEAPANLRRHGFIELFPCHPERPEHDDPTLTFFYYGPPGSEARVYYLLSR